MASIAQYRHSQYKPTANIRHSCLHVSSTNYTAVLVCSSQPCSTRRPPYRPGQKRKARVSNELRMRSSSGFAEATDLASKRYGASLEPGASSGACTTPLGTKGSSALPYSPCALISVVAFGRTAMSGMVGSLVAAQSRSTCRRKALLLSTTFAHHSRSTSTAASRTRTARALSRAPAGTGQSRAWQARAGQRGAWQCEARRALSTTSTATDDVMYLPMPKLSPNMVRLL